MAFTHHKKDWKEQALEGIEQSFLNKVTKSSDRTQALLYEEIGRLKVENEFLKKNFNANEYSTNTVN